MSTFKSDSGRNCSESTYGSCGTRHDQKPCTGDSSRQDFVAGSRWWLNRHGLGGEYTLDQLSMFGAEVKLSGDGDVHGSEKLRGENQLIEEYWTTCPKNCAAFCEGASLKRGCSHCKDYGDSQSPDFEATVIDDVLSNVDMMDLDTCNSLLLEQSKKLSSDLDSHWIGLKKAQPWWHAADKDELASLVSQTSSHHVQNDGCPGVEVLKVEKISDNHIDSFHHFNEQIINKEVLNVADCAQASVTSATLGKSLSRQGLMECLLQESDRTFSSRDGLSTTFNKKEGSNATKTDSPDTQEPTSSALTRGQLLEALCHSQTRAREAEKLAQKACDEKDHVINLFFHQASCLFAYRQWIRLLQLESLCLHLRSKSQLPPFTPPSFLPWVRNKRMTVGKSQHRAAKKQQRKQMCHINKCAIAFAVGLSLAGAGLLVGWTIGWLFPAF